MAQDIVAGFQENPQTLNRYSYVINNPKTYIDPTGEFFDALLGKAESALKKVGDALIGVAYSLVDDLIFEPLLFVAQGIDKETEKLTGELSFMAYSVEKSRENLEEYVLNHIQTRIGIMEAGWSGMPRQR